jgi:hypothetical protein
VFAGAIPFFQESILLVSINVNIFSEGIPLFLPEPLVRVLGLCVLQAPLCNGLFSLLGVATVAWFFTADTLPLSFFDGCFAIVVIAARADALPPMSLQAPSHADFAECVMPPF